MRTRSRRRTVAKRQLLVGFELEFGSKALDLKTGGPHQVGLRPLHLDIGTLGDDAGCYEFRTFPVTGDRAEKTLLSALGLLRGWKAKTRHNDGLHINVSFSDKTLNKSLNPISVWHLAGVHRWAETFGRTRNWCSRMPRGRTPCDVLDFLRSVPSCSKDIAINFTHFCPKGRGANSRVEFRFPGGKNYHLRGRILSRCLDEVLSAMSNSLEV